jgi:GNAT superfamily N-acetyltransferase
MDVQTMAVTVDQIIDLRHAALRQGLPRESAEFDGDRGPGAIHYGAYDGAKLVGCTTLHLSQWEGEPAWQLRGMAVADDYRNKGVGRLLLEEVDRGVSQSPVRLLWCNARVPASGFYQKHGWLVVSEVFEIPTAGPHVRMIKRP